MAMHRVAGSAGTNTAILRTEAEVSIAARSIAARIEPVIEPGTDLRLGRSVSIDQAAHLLSVSRRTVYNRIRDGRLHTIRTLGGSQRVLVESLYDVGFRPQAFSTSASAATFAVRPART